MNKKPICSNPINGSMETVSGYRLCCNPKHSKESNPLLGPVWHSIADWPTRKKTIEERREDGEAICARCGHALGTCPRCQHGETGERHCPICDWCEACGRSGK